MISHVSSLYTMISTLPNRSGDQKHKEWEKIESTISRQLSLRVLSCIQVASKIHSYNDVIILIFIDFNISKNVCKNLLNKKKLF